MSTITVSLIDSDDETVTAAYYQIEDGWVWFKTEDHKAVMSYPEKRVTRIMSELEQPTRLEGRLSYAATPAPISEEAVRANAVKWAEINKTVGL